MHITYNRVTTAAVIARTDFTDLVADDLRLHLDAFQFLLVELNEADAFSFPAAPATGVTLELVETFTTDGESHADVEIALRRTNDGRTFDAVLRCGDYSDIAVANNASGEQVAMDVVAALTELADAAVRDLLEVIT